MRELLLLLRQELPGRPLGTFKAGRYRWECRHQLEVLVFGQAEEGVLDAVQPCIVWG